MHGASPNDTPSANSNMEKHLNTLLGKPISSLHELSADYIKPIIRTCTGSTAKIIGFIFGAKVMAHIMTIIIGILIARNLGPEGKGILAALFIVPRFVSSFGHLGLPISNIYFLGKKADKETLLINSVYFITIASVIYIFCASLAIPILKKTYFSGIGSLYLIYLVLFHISVLLTRDFIKSFIRGFEKYKEFSYIDIIQRCVKLAFIVFFLSFFHLSVEIVIIAILTSHVLSFIYGYRTLQKVVKLSWQEANYSQFKKNLSYGLKEQLGYIFAYFNTDIQFLMLAAFMDMRSLGIYSLALSFLNLFSMIPNSLTVILLPKISRSTLKGAQHIVRKSIFANTSLLTAGFLIFFLVGKWLILFLYGVEFSDAYSLGLILLSGHILSSNCKIFNKYFSGVGKPEIKSFIRAINIPFMAASFYLLVSRFGLVGAAWAFVVTALILLIITIFFYLRISSNLEANFRDAAE